MLIKLTNRSFNSHNLLSHCRHLFGKLKNLQIVFLSENVRRGEGLVALPLSLSISLSLKHPHMHILRFCLTHIQIAIVHFQTNMSKTSIPSFSEHVFLFQSCEGVHECVFIMYQCFCMRWCERERVCVSWAIVWVGVFVGERKRQRKGDYVFFIFFPPMITEAGPSEQRGRVKTIGRPARARARRAWAASRATAASTKKGHYFF